MYISDAATPLEPPMVEELRAILVATETELERRRYRDARARVADINVVIRGPVNDVPASPETVLTPQYAFALLAKLTSDIQPGVAGRDIYLKVGALLDVVDWLAEKEEERERAAEQRRDTQAPPKGS